MSRQQQMKDKVFVYRDYVRRFNELGNTYMRGSPRTTEEAYPDIEEMVVPRLKMRPNKSKAGMQYAERIEIYDPPPGLEHDLDGCALTRGKEYSILSEREIGDVVSSDPKNGSKHHTEYRYRIEDDNGRPLILPWQYFRQPQWIRQETYQSLKAGNIVEYVDTTEKPKSIKKRVYAEKRLEESSEEEEACDEGKG